MKDDWDLQAVVRGCYTATSSTTPSTTSTTNNNNTYFNKLDFHSTPSSSSSSSSSFSFASFGSSTQQQASQVLFSLPDPIIKPRSAIEELHELYKPFFPKSHHPPLSFSSSSSLNSLSPLTAPRDHHPIQQLRHIHHQQQQQSSKPSSNSSSTTTINQRSKRRKNQLKKVCQVPQESLSSDIWAWRKYGQKPIKGSPYPRGYYKCSSSKGCMARKQVERNRSDPNIFIVTYTAEHNHAAPTHRNSLAGSTRQKPFSPPLTTSVTAGDSTQLTTSSCLITSAASKEPPPVVRQSTTMESCKEEKTMSSTSPTMVDENEVFGMCDDSVVSNDFFTGLEGLAEDYFSDHSSPSFGMPWINSGGSGATAAGSI